MQGQTGRKPVKISYPRYLPRLFQACIFDRPGYGGNRMHKHVKQCWNRVCGSRVNYFDRVGSQVSVTDPVSDPVFVVCMHALYCCFWGENTPSWNLWDSVCSVFSRRLSQFRFLVICWKIFVICICAA